MINLELDIYFIFFTLSGMVLSSSRIGGGTGSPEISLTAPKRGGASFKARSAFYAFLLGNYMDLVLATVDRLGRAFPKANHTDLTLIWVNIVRDDFTKQLFYLVTGEKFIIFFFFIKM